MGPLMLDIEGLELTAADKERLAHPQCAGVILFSRNFESVEQVTSLVKSVRAAVASPLLIGVDQEGGRVQRFRGGFFPLPPQRRIGELYDKSPQDGIRVANQMGWIMASEIRALGIDFSFAPVLDLDHGYSSVIGDRALHSDPSAVTALGRAYSWGMKKAGMPAIAKHFPGHGYVVADSHTAVAVDERSLAEIEEKDLKPFAELVGLGLEAVMPAHVIYPACDARPAGFSPFWLQDILRAQLGFKGAVVSDDLSMTAAADFGDPVTRARAALDAGCNLLLMCNNPASADQVLAGFESAGVRTDSSTLGLLRGRGQCDWDSVHVDPAWRQADAAIRQWLA